MKVSVGIGDGIGLNRVKNTLCSAGIAFFPCAREKRTKAFGEKKTKALEFSPFCAWCLHELLALLERMKSTLHFRRSWCQKDSKNTTNMQSKWCIPSSSYRLNVFNLSPFSNFRSS